MSETALRMENVFKKFRKGEIYDSLRDLLPAMTGRLFRRAELDASDKREFWALQDVSFEVKKGEAFAIIGHNGAGKSTILKILSRIMNPTKGNMRVNGRLSSLIEVAAGFHNDLTGLENVYLNGTILGMTRAEVNRKLDSIVEFSGLADFIDTPVKRYSTGMYARLGFSVAAHVEPDVMIVDEVLSVGDYMFQQKCIARMMEIIKGGATVVFVSHNLKSVSELCTRSLLLDHGQVVKVGDTNEIIGDYLDSVRAARSTDSDKPAQITHVTLKSGDDDCTLFEWGQRARLEIRALVREHARNVVLFVSIKDNGHYVVFDTSSERLGIAPHELHPGDILSYSLDFDVSMFSGTYHVSVGLHRYETERPLDVWEPAATFFVNSTYKGCRGVVNCRPEVVHQSIESGQS